MKIAVVAAGYADPWREDHLVARRVSGALACFADVDLLIPGGPRAAVAHDGAARVLLFRSTPYESRRRMAWRRAALGVGPHDELSTAVAPHRRDLPDFVEKEMLAAEGGDAPELYEHLHEQPYDLVVFIGYHTPLAYRGAQALPDDRRIVLVPASRDDSTLWLRIHDELFERSERFLVCTESERIWLTDRLGAAAATRIENVGFVIGVNSLGEKTEPPDFDGKSYVIIARNWHTATDLARPLRWGRHFEGGPHRDLHVRFVGPGADRIPFGLARTAGRLDICRWVSRAVALLDPIPRRVVGREVLEALNYRTPVIVNAQGGANREHAEDGNSGLWYRTDFELYAAVEVLLDKDANTALGQQGQAYAQETFGDADTYIKNLNSVLFP